ncbi:Uncharacterized protein J7T55_003380 [Diaporthe amygdali]|uniref:uncharacterized protein n=1 Tax=Phomopsis amygdali TaxID=1214568 RepID=UPI0022FDD396|nr:uncharacterized protein J7T55_003380 [Diaporthe amygdali]KAJ0116966.1 Uncharacterized protein J7T55_003380 [Diaporthe amygdali]
MKTTLIASFLVTNVYALVSLPNLTSYPASVGHAVANLDETLKFYHDLVGLVVLHQDEGPVNDPAYGELTNTSSATYKTAIVAIPNQRWTLNLVEYIGLPREQVKQREQDPGDPGLTLTVKNSSAINKALRAANVTTILGEPAPEGGAEGTTSTVWVYDPDGYMVELVQRSGPSDFFTVSPPNITDGPGMEFVIRGQLDLTLSNVTQAITFYRDILRQNISRGFEPLIGPGYDSLGFVGTIFNLSTDTQWAAVTGNCDPDTRCEYYKYDAPDRVSIIYPANYPGIGITTYNVKGLDGVIQKVQAAGLTIVTQGGVPVRVNGRRSIVVRDPSGYLVRLEEEF